MSAAKMIRCGILLFAAIVQFANACCPYFDSAEWKMKQRLFQEYAHGETNEKCLGYTESFKWHPSRDSNYCYMMAFRFWCRAECTKTCGDPAHYPPQGWVTCRGKDCNNNWYPMVYCECLYGTGSCNTGIVMWTVVEQFYYAHCLSHLSIQKYALLATLSGVSRQYMTGPLYDQMYPHATPPPVQQVQPGPVQRIQVQPNPVQQKPQIQPPPVQQRPPARPPAIVPRPPVAPPPVAHPPAPKPPPPAHPHITPPPVAKKIVQPPPPAPKPVKQPEPMKPKAYVTPPLYKHAPIKTPPPYAGIKPKAPLVVPKKPIPAAPKIVKKPLPQPPKLQRVYVKPPQVKQPKCAYWQSNDWKAKASQFTAFVSGTTKQQCQTENEAVQWAPDAAEGSRCNELGLAVKHFCIAKCRTDCQVQLAPASAAAKPKCLAKGCEIACLCNTWCQTERTPWAEVENKYKLECLGALCQYLQTKMWQDNLKSYTAAAAGAAGTATGLMPQCSADIAAVHKQWEDPANNDQCKELSLVIQYWCLKQCIATCGNPSTYGGAKLSCASMTKCDQNGYPFSYCKCKPGCATGATSAQQIEERFRADCLPPTTKVVVPQGQCKYFESADWMAKKDLFFSYRQLVHSEQCFNEQKGIAWSSTPNAANYKGCDQLGFVVKYWCAKQCKAKCPQALQAAASLACEIQTCDAGQLPLLYCHCTPDCRTKVVSWSQIAEDFTFNCLKSHEDLQCPYMKTQEWLTNQLRFTQFVTGTTREECQTELQGISFDLTTADNNQCGILGISVKHWCYRKCKSTCGPPSTSADVHIRCVTSGCYNNYPEVSCECSKTCNIESTPWPMIESQYTADCLHVNPKVRIDISVLIGGTNCGYFSTSAWKDKKTMFTEYIKFITKDDCYKSISAAEFVASNTTSVAAGATVSGVGTCEQLGLAAKYWCLKACETDCPGDHASGISCASDKCDGKYPTLTCKCSASCQSKAQTWTAIETKYEKECINDPTSNHWQQNISNNVFVYLPSAPPPGQITIQKHQECPYLSQAGVGAKLQTYNANAKCASVVSGVKFAQDGKDSECNKLGLVAKNWCFRNCKELFGDPLLYSSPIRCVTEACINDHPIVACHCKQGSKTDGSPFPMLETRFQDDCTAPKESPKKEEARKKTLCPYFSTDAWEDNRVMFTQFLRHLTQDNCQFDLNGVHWDLTSAESICKPLGLSIKHWCYQQCAEPCGDPRTYDSDNKIGCISKECDAEGNAMMICQCTKDCSTPVTNWQTIEATYEKDCLEGPQACQVCNSKNTFELSVTLAVGGENNVTPALAPPGNN